MNTVTARSTGRVFATNKLIRNTYLLLSMTLAFAAVMAMVALNTGARPMHWIVTLAVMIGMPFLINAVRNTVWALPLTFVFTGTLGYILGPIVGHYLHLPNGTQIVATSLALTAGMFIALSGYALATRKNFSFLGGFLFIGLILALIAMVANIFLNIPALSLTISAAMVLLISGSILYDTSRMVHDGEGNYVMMTVSLFADIYVLFVHLLNLTSFFDE